MQIRTRLTLLFFLITSTLLTAALLAIFVLTEQNQKADFFKLLEARANTTADLLIEVDEIDSALLKQIDSTKKDVLFYENISIYDSQNTEIYTNNDTLDFANIIPDFAGFLEAVDKSEKEQITIDEIDIVGLKRVGKGKKITVIACAIDKLGKAALKRLFINLLWVFGLIIVIIALAGWIFAYRALKPISGIISQVNSISPNNLNFRIRRGNNDDEIAQLADTFNNLLERIEHAFAVQKIFVANASHEIRNPLTSITSQLEVTLLKKRDADTYEKTLNSVLEDVKRLNEMSHRLLMLAKLENKSNLVSLDYVRPDDLVWETKNEFTLAYPNYTVNLHMSQLPENERELVIQGNSFFLKTCFLNLMDNACKFSQNKTVSIDVYLKNKFIHIDFSDNGIGIDEADLKHIFEPFFRGKNAGKVNGYGVGLSLVEKIVRAYGGSISISSHPTVGSKIALSFPLAH